MDASREKSALPDTNAMESFFKLEGMAGGENSRQ
jgi:hypothetical protein